MTTDWCDSRRHPVEPFGTLPFPLVSGVRPADRKDAADAKEKLAKIGARAVKSRGPW